MKKGILIGLSMLVMLSAASCSSSRKASYDQQRAGLLMLEGEHIYKNKGFYKAKKSHKTRRKNKRAAKRYYTRTR